MKIAVIGLGQFGSQLAIELADLKHEVLAVDKNELVIDSLKGRVTHAVIADATDARALEELGLDEFDAVCVTIGEDFSASLIIIGLLQEMRVEHLYCRVINKVHERILGLMKVEHMIQAEALAARQLAKRMGVRGATRHFGLSDEHSIVELAAPEGILGRQLQEVNLRNRFAINLVTVKREGKVLGVPPPTLVFQQGDELVVFGDDTAIKAFSTCKRM